MRTAAVALLALCMGCASIVPIEEIAPVVASDALERLPQAGRRQIATGRIDFPLLAAAVFVESNRERRKHDLPSLAYLPALETISTLHASDMALHRFFNHVNPVDAYRRTLADRLDLVDLPASFYAENIARTFPLQIDIRTDQPGALHSTVYPLDTPGQFSLTPNGPPIPPHTYASFAHDLVEDWMNSPSHRSNLLDTQAKYLGCGCALEVDEVGFPTLVCGQVFYAY